MIADPPKPAAIWGSPGHDHADASRSALPSGTITFLFTDVERSIWLWDTHPEAMRAALVRAHGIEDHVRSRAGGFHAHLAVRAALDQRAVRRPVEGLGVGYEWAVP